MSQRLHGQALLFCGAGSQDTVLAKEKSNPDRGVLCCGALSFDTLKRRAYVGEEELKLTKKELGILEYLLLNMGSH
ncbi:hypothetical protein [Suipraeoptans intestinalis]|uniref:hypothetical protein n=1 Tax=Suipraeoptans intestinalis TaxID=2606628 RepID=UPI002ED68FA8